MPTLDDHASHPKTTEKPGDTYVQSFARGLSVRRSFSARHREQTLTEVATASSLTGAGPGPGRILLTLETLGYVQAEDRSGSRRKSSIWASLI